MKTLIVRMYPNVININSYNCQELGLAKALVRKGIQCDIVLYTDRKNNYEEDIIFDSNKKIHIYHLRGKNILKNCFFEKRLYEIVKEYDIVQTAEYDQIANVKLRKKCKKMVIYHGPYESDFTKGYKKKCLLSDIYYLFHKSYKSTKCISKSNLATSFLTKKGFKNVTTVGVGIDTDRFTTNNSNELSMKEILKLDKPTTQKYLLYIGRLEERRNLPFLLELFSDVIKKNDDYRLIIVGDGEKEYVNMMNNIVKEHNLENKIYYFKKLDQNELSYLYLNCELFILPTQYEIFGMVILESMHFGLPVITTYNGGSSILITNNKNGFICDINNKQEWKKCILSIAKDKSLKAKISKEAKETIDKNFTWDKLSNIFIKQYLD